MVWDGGRGPFYLQPSKEGPKLATDICIKAHEVGKQQSTHWITGKQSRVSVCLLKGLISSAPCGTAAYKFSMRAQFLGRRAAPSERLVPGNRERKKWWRNSFALKQFCSCRSQSADWILNQCLHSLHFSPEGSQVVIWADWGRFGDTTPQCKAMAAAQCVEHSTVQNLVLPDLNDTFTNFNSRKPVETNESTCSMHFWEEKVVPRTLQSIDQINCWMSRHGCLQKKLNDWLWEMLAVSFQWAEQD